MPQHNYCPPVLFGVKVILGHDLSRVFETNRGRTLELSIGTRLFLPHYVRPEVHL